MDAYISEVLAELWMILRESSVWLILGFAMAGLVHAFIPKGFLAGHLGGRGALPIAKASLLGIPMPLCSCSVIPVAASLRRSGAGKGPSAAFAISTPQTGEESIPLTWALFGPVYAITRPIVAVVTAFLAGTLIDATDRDDRPTRGAAPHSCCAPGVATKDYGSGDVSLSILEDAKPTIGSRIRDALSHGFSTMLMDLALWLSIGIFLAALVGALVPHEWVQAHAGSGLAPKLAMLAVGIPLYICATSSTPLAFALVSAGLSPGAALVLLLSGPATNAATMSWLLKDLGVRALVIYIATIALVALGAGVAFDALLAGTVMLAGAGAEHAHASGAWGVTKDLGAVAMIVLLAQALGRKANGWLRARGLASDRARDDHACCSTRG